jgi:hypothetical protein
LDKKSLSWNTLTLLYDDCQYISLLGYTRRKQNRGVALGKIEADGKVCLQINYTKWTVTYGVEKNCIIFSHIQTF